MVRIMKQFRANQGRFGQNKARLGQNKCGFANLQTRINTGGDGGIRTHVPFRTTRFRVELVMTASIRLHLIII